MARRTTNVEKPGQRWCPKCEGYLPISEFGGMPSHFDGIDPYCKEHRKEARKTSRERIRARLRANKEARNLTEKQARRLASEILGGMGYEDVARRLVDDLDSDVGQAQDGDARGG